MLGVSYFIPSSAKVKAQRDVALWTVNTETLKRDAYLFEVQLSTCSLLEGGVDIEVRVEFALQLCPFDANRWKTVPLVSRTINCNSCGVNLRTMHPPIVKNDLVDMVCDVLCRKLRRRLSHVLGQGFPSPVDES